MKKKLIIGPRIKRLRSMLGLTQAEFARRLDVSATYVNLIERNQRPVSATVLLKLAEEFDINVELFGGAGDVVPDASVVLVDRNCRSKERPTVVGERVGNDTRAVEAEHGVHGLVGSHHQQREPAIGQSERGLRLAPRRRDRQRRR